MQTSPPKLAETVLVDLRADSAAWSQYGTLLDAVDLLRVELATALTPASTSSTPPPLAGVQRRAVRRAVTRHWRG